MKVDATKRRNAISKHIFCYSLLLVPIIHFIIFWLLVNVNTLLLPFQQEKTGSFTWDNFKYIFTLLGAGGELQVALLNTLRYYIQHMLTAFVIAPLFAYFLYKNILGSKLFNILFMLPMIVSGIVMISIYKTMVGADGPISVLYEKITGNSMPFLLYDDSSATATIIAYCIWTGFGMNLILFSGAMVRIPTEIIESVQLDGIGFFKEFFTIELPLIWPTLSITLLVSVNTIFMSTGPILYFTQGMYKTYTIHYWFYANVIVLGNYNKAAALGILLSAAGAPAAIIVAVIRHKFKTDVKY